MSNENNKMQVDIENLFKQNVNDLSTIKELYRKLKEVEEKFLQIKYIDSTLANKLKKEYEKLKRIILDENIQAKLANDIETINEKLTNDIDELNIKLTNDIDELNTKLTDDIETINSHTSQLTNDIGTINSQLIANTKQKYKVINIKEYGINNDVDLNNFLLNNKNLEGNTLYQPEDHELILNNTVDCRFYDIDFRGKIKTNFNSGSYLLVGNSSNISKPTNIFINMLYDKVAKRIKRSNMEDCSLRIVGVLNGKIELRDISSVLLFADSTEQSDLKYKISGISYSTFNMGKVDTLCIKGNDDKAWITECTFIKGRYLNIILDGGFPPSELYFINPCLELANVEIYKGERNKFINIRDEGDFSLKLDEGAKYNYFESSYASKPTISYNSLPNIVDEGIGNIYINPSTFLGNPVIVYDLIPNLTFSSKENTLFKIDNLESGGNQIGVEDGKLTLKRYAKLINNLRCSKNIDRITIESDGVESLTFDIMAYDINDNVLIPTKNDLTTYHFLAPGITFNTSTNKYGVGASINSTTIIVNNPSVAYFDLTISTGTYDAADTVVNSNRIKVIMYKNPKNFIEIEKIIYSLRKIF